MMNITGNYEYSTHCACESWPRQCLAVIARTHVSTYVHAYGVRVRIEKKKRQPVVLCARDHRAPLSKATSSRLYREKITSRFSTYIGLQSVSSRTFLSRTKI